MSFFAPSPARIAAPRVRHTLIPHWLTHLGALGLFSVAVLDSSIIPLPIPGSTDLLLLWLISHNGDPWLLALTAIAGSLIGGYSTWHIGRKGGEAALHRWVSARLLGRIVAWVGSHPVLAVFLPAVLPPPIPLSPFILASGALGVTRNRFLAAYGAARTLRYSFIAWLAVAYGRRVVRLWSKELAKWSTPLLIVFVAVLVVGLGFGLWQYRGHSKSRPARDPALSPETARAD
jgi:membrane protein YqaA with SNARE-associated domain